MLVRRAATDLDTRVTQQEPSRFIGAPTNLHLERTIEGEVPEDEYIYLSDQPFSMPSAAPPNLTRGRSLETPAEKHWWLWGLRGGLPARRSGRVR